MQCLLTVDVQNGFVNAETAHLIPKINQLVNSTYFKHKFASLYHNTVESPFTKFLGLNEMIIGKDLEFADGLDYQAFDEVFVTQGYSAYTAEFKSLIAANKIDEVYICGLGVNTSILKTALDLFEAGVRPMILTGYCGSTEGLPAKYGLENIKICIGENQMVDATL